MIWLWIGIMVLAFLIEMLSMDLLSIWFFAGALVAFVVALFNLNVGVQVTTFLIVSFILIILIRPIAKKYFQVNIVKTNLDRVVGKTAITTEGISRNVRGSVKVDGKEWSAITLNNEVINAGDEVEILAIEGVKLIVRKIN